MLAQLSRRLSINGGRASFFKTLLQYSTSTATSAEPPQKNYFLEEYLINSIGFSKEEATSALMKHKVSRLKPIKKDLNLVVNFFQDLGLNKTQVKSIVFASPTLLFNDLDKTLKPKIRVFQDLGLSGSDLVKFIMAHKTLFRAGLDCYIRPRIDCLRKLLGSDDKVVVALKRCSFLLGRCAPQYLARNVLLLQKLGISDENVAKFMLRNPRAALSLNPGRIEKICQRVENELGINRESAIFFNGFVVMSSVSKSKFDLKWEIFRSFDWSDANIHKLLGNLPSILTLSEARMKEALDFLMRELGYGPDYLASRPRLFTLSLEKRVKLRNEVLKILNAKKLNKRKASLYSVLCLSELKFVEGYLLPYKDEIPDIYESYTRIY